MKARIWAELRGHDYLLHAERPAPVFWWHWEITPSGLSGREPTWGWAMQAVAFHWWFLR